jgi:hypothetical protein
MCDTQSLARNSVTLQERMFRLAERDFGLSLAVLSTETGIPKPTLRDWKAGTTMPAWALFALGRAGVPDYLTSLIANPFGKHVGSDSLDDSALHEAVTAASEVVSEYLTATSPESEGKQSITPREKARILEKAERAGGKLRAVGTSPVRAVAA